LGEVEGVVELVTGTKGRFNNGMGKKAFISTIAEDCPTCY
jgi:hypothetical protein